MSAASPLLCRPTEISDGYVFDLDGTPYLGNDLVPGSARLLEALRELDRRIAFASNNPTRTPAQYVDKLRASASTPASRRSLIAAGNRRLGAV